MNQLALTLEFRPTGPTDWLLSFRETRRELRMGRGLIVLGAHIVQRAAAVSGDHWLIESALCGLVEESLLEPSHYMPGALMPCLVPHPGRMVYARRDEPHGWQGRQTSAWSWKFRIPSALPWKCIRP